MKFPNHLITDFNNYNINYYWIKKFNYINNKNINFYNLNLIKKNFFNNNNNFNFKKNNKIIFFSNNQNLWNIFNINFLKKEKMYTKLKYSRVPQYDIVSGGVAALFSGFLGFLISEKFGFELIDSGDFYILFMYIVFLSFTLKPFLKIIINNNLSWNLLSLKWFFFFYKNIIFLLLFKIK